MKNMWKYGLPYIINDFCGFDLQIKVSQILWKLYIICTQTHWMQLQSRSIFKRTISFLMIIFSVWKKNVKLKNFQPQEFLNAIGITHVFVEENDSCEKRSL